MNSDDFQICQNVISALASPKYEKYNYLFLEPVDLTHFPTYTSIVRRPMDLGTVANNLNSGMYRTKQEFLADTTLCFENAELFHRDKPENQWIIKMALKMKKNVNKEFKSAGKKMNGTASSSGSKNSVLSSNAGGASDGTGGTAAATTSSSKKRLNISLKGANRMSNKSPSEKSSDGTATPIERKKKKKQKTGDGGIASSGAVGGAIGDTTKSSQKPKLSLKLNKQPAAQSSNVSTSQASGAASSVRSASPPNANQKTPKPKLKLKLGTKKTPAPKASLSVPVSSSSKSSTQTSVTTPKSATTKITIPKSNASKSTTPKSATSKGIVIKKKSSTKSSTTPKVVLKNNIATKASVVGIKSTSPKAGSKSSNVVKSISAATKNTTSKVSSKNTSTAKSSATKDKTLKIKSGRSVSPKNISSKVSKKSSSPTSDSSVNTTSTSEKKSKSSKPTSTPKSTPSAPSRGKELPSAIAEAKANAKKETAAAKASAKKETTSASTKPNNSKKDSNKKETSTVKKESRKTNRTPKIKTSTMTPKYKAQCSKILSALKQREENVGLFLKPVAKSLPKASIQEYEKQIPFPMDISTMNTKLEKKSYSSVLDFVLDLRRIFGNCFRYNISSSDDTKRLRVNARKMLMSSEQFLHHFLPNEDSGSGKFLYPKLLYCLNFCFEKILDPILDLKNPEDNQQTVWYFIHPASYFFGGNLSQAYKNKVKNPMDFGTITSNLIEGAYQSVDAFVRDCRLVTSNCKAFYRDEENGKVFVAQANRLEEFISPQLDSLLKYDQSEKGLEARKIAANPTPVKLLKPTPEFYSAILDELRSANYTDRYTQITEKAADQFEHPVDISLFKDYLQYVDSPMDLKTVESRISSGAYELPEDFEYDINLTFKNCEVYNIPKRNTHIVSLSRYCAKLFKNLYTSRFKAFEESGGKKLFGDDKKDRKRSPDSQPVSSLPPPTKKIKIESTSSKRKSPVLGKPTDQQPNSKRVSNSKGKSSKPTEKRTLPRIVIRNDGPLPLHVAIAKIKEKFSCRRQHKELSDWEEGCSKFFRDLKKHPWVSSSKRFVFDAPVPMLHPEIKEAYMMQIKKPMDLTTAEGKLLQGGFYSEPQEFVDDVALVFSNAVKFNESGSEQGDPTSMAYFDASKHLLRYTRWLSLHNLSSCITEDMHSEGSRQSGPLPHWKLTKTNLDDARYEMENIVLKQEIDKSEEGERFTWGEIECERLLKSLRFQSDHKHMLYFIKPEYPADYVAVVSKPIAWETCNEKLQRRKYDTFGEIISDLRLIFSNALLYNGKMKEFDPTSQVAYDSAKRMSEKLEAAIQRLFITAADRIEREKVEDRILSREEEIAQKAEDERARAELQNRDRVRRNNNTTGTSTTTPSVKIVQRRPVRRDIYFDNPFTDQDNSYEQSEMNLLNKQKVMYEKQQCERLEMHHVTNNVGFRVFHNLSWRSRAINWSIKLSETIYRKMAQNPQLQRPTEKIEKDEQIQNSKKDGTPKASVVSSLLEDSNRTQIKLQLGKSKSKQNRKKRRRLFLD